MIPKNVESGNPENISKRIVNPGSKWIIVDCREWREVLRLNVPPQLVKHLVIVLVK